MENKRHAGGVGWRLVCGGRDGKERCDHQRGAVFFVFFEPETTTSLLTQPR
jgi:hypothetical protein